MRRPRLLVGAVVTMLAVTGCRLDTEVRVDMEADGTGTVTVTATADAELVDRVPDLAEQLRFGDARAAGWSVDGPAANDDGGATVVLAHDFVDAREATALVRSLGGPLRDVTVRRRVTGDPGDPEATATNSLAGTAVLSGGFEAFADQALIDAVGGLPFADELADQDPAATMSVTLDVSLPGEVTATNGERDGDSVRWDLPLGGREQMLQLDTSQTAAASGSGWAGPVATIALVALFGWLAVSLSFVGYVAVKRSRR